MGIEPKTSAHRLVAPSNVRELVVPEAIQLVSPLLTCMTETKLIILASKNQRKKHKGPIRPKGRTCRKCQTRGNAYEQVKIGFGFSSY